ncbi:NAD(P)H-hydrate dehydratase [Alkalimarinus alittae]|uniref:Bifunctional NAD(P)H-hydrate repair enzyme n=1 Tax=Alkalimarinus alittae TaxID=2961619 RepID=A0ABY6N4Q9_9ALTE|nr:NAD(P)H-hydrate dehydratase [Alkalimarinus alittae]UZE96990.1 NAD(P)H-hydrate dehydratase [Alkalimarinus alittae]
MNRALKSPLSPFEDKALPRELYTAKQVRALDRLAMETMPINGFDLMKQAGKAAFRMMLRLWPETPSLSVFCGGGNNGGDGLVIAGLAAQKGLSVEVILLADTESLSGEAAEAWAWLQQLDVFSSLTIMAWQVGLQVQGALIVDCLLGTGLIGDVRGGYASAISAINLLGRPVFAVDIPSGLCSDTGRVLGCAVKAQRTITFIGLKQGLLTGEGPNVVGVLKYDSLGVPETVLTRINPCCLRADWREFEAKLPKRQRAAHKGIYGRVLVIGGDHGMAGAALMAAEAACRVGAGLVYVATRPAHVSAFIARQPEIMAQGIDIAQYLGSMIDGVDVVVIGPGLGQAAWGQQLFQAVMHTNKPMIVDADALNLLAKLNPESRHNWILTPHPGEAARLLNCSIETIERNRFQAATELQQKYGGTIILKGAGTLIAVEPQGNEKATWLANTGNPGMASGGMGDVLSGILGGLLAQKNIDSMMVGPAAVTLHGESANLARLSVGEYSLLASDVLAAIPQLLRVV